MAQFDAIAWRSSTPGAALFREISDIVRSIVDTELSPELRLATLSGAGE